MHCGIERRRTARCLRAMLMSGREGDQSAYVGTQDVARDYANPKVGGYENGYVRVVG